MGVTRWLSGCDTVAKWPSFLEAGSFIGYQAELNIKARPGQVSSLGVRLTMQQMLKRHENSYTIDIQKKPEVS